MKSSVHKRSVFWSGVFAAAMFLVIANTALVSPASAAVVGEPREQVVVYSDLNLADAKAVSRLHARIRQAAVRVCGSPDGYYLRIRQLRRDCISEAIETAVREIDHPGLTAYHTSKGRGARLAQLRTDVH